MSAATILAAWKVADTGGAPNAGGTIPIAKVADEVILTLQRGVGRSSCCFCVSLERKVTEPENIVVFTPSEIQTAFDGSGVVSTGALELALEGEYTVYVATTRSQLLEVDEWWLSFLARHCDYAEERVFLADPYSKAAGGVSLDMGWRQLYEELDIPWPYARGHSWALAREALSRKHGIKLGRDFMN